MKSLKIKEKYGERKIFQLNWNTFGRILQTRDFMKRQRIIQTGGASVFIPEIWYKEGMICRIENLGDVA